MNSIKLYNYFRSSTSYRVRIALHLKDLSFDYIPVHLLKDGGEQHTTAYRKLNSMGGVPTLVDLKKPIAQSSAIIEYLDEAYTDSYQLLPKDLYQRAVVRQFCQIINADTHAYANLRTLQYLEKDLNVNEENKKIWIKHWITLGLTACEKMIEAYQKQHNNNNNSTDHNYSADHEQDTSNTSEVKNRTKPTKYCFSNEITAAEVFLIPQLFTAERFAVNLDNFPNLKRINEECLKHPAFIKAHPFRQIDTPDELKQT